MRIKSESFILLYMRIKFIYQYEKMNRDKLISALNMQIDAISFFLLFQISLNYEEYIYIYFEGIK